MNVLRSRLLIGVLLLASCASTTSNQTSPSSTTATPRTSITTTPPSSTTTAVAETTTELETTTVPEPANEPPLQCTIITDFDDTNNAPGETAVRDTAVSKNAAWLVVNDDVMGGRSLGERTFINNTMIFTGSINTNGGGFSSLRLPLEPGALVAADRIVFRARSDGRTYMVTFDDSLDGRDRRISFRAPLEFRDTGQWETVTVLFADLFPAAFGQPVASEPFRQDLATRMGIMLSDGLDGDFQLEVDSIEVCSPT